MRRIWPVVFITAAVFSVNTPSAQQFDAQAAAVRTVLPTTLPELRAWDSLITQASRSGTLRLVSERRDPTLPSRSTERFEQYHEGLRIWGADIVRDSDGAVPISIFGVLAPPLSLDVRPTLNAQTGRELLLRRAMGDAALLTEPELVIVQSPSEEYRLAYSAVVADDRGIDRVFIDAHNGVELMRYTELKQQDASVGLGTGVLGDRKKLSVEVDAGTYIAFDRLRPPIIETFDMRSNLNRTKALERGLLNYLPSDLARDSDNTWNDVAVVDAHVHVSWTYDYYYKRFGRSGLDGRDSPIDIVVNAVSQTGALSLPNADFDYVMNANWCGECGPGGRGRIYFGNGLPEGFFFTSTGQNFTYLSGALDVAAHELTHAVVEATSGLIYLNESGALDEAFADMMGKSAEFFFHPAGPGVGQADYVIGKDVVRGIRPGALNGIRSMENPRMFGDPDHYAQRYRGQEDSGGVHTNSGIPNQAFYLSIEGGTNRTSGISVQGVGANNREQMEKVFYRAFTTLMPASATFAIARRATLQAARDLYGEGSNAERAVTQAWAAVGVN